MRCPTRGDHDSHSAVCQVLVEFQPAGKKSRRVGLQRLCTAVSGCLRCLHPKLASATCLPGMGLCIRLFVCPLLRSPWRVLSCSWGQAQEKMFQVCPQLAVTAVGSCSPQKGCSPCWWLMSPSWQGQALGCAWWGQAHRNVDCDQMESLVFKITLSASSITSHSSQPSKCWFSLLNKGLHWIWFFLFLVRCWTSPPDVYDRSPRFIETLKFSPCKNLQYHFEF